LAAKAVGDVNKSLVSNDLVSSLSDETHRCGCSRLWVVFVSESLSERLKL